MLFPLPGTKIRFGLDPILGLLPGGGDTITGGISAYIVVEAARMGLPREVLYKMVGNILLDSFAGTIPVLGDIFDVGWKSNVKNIELLEKHLEIAEDSKSNTLFIIGLIVLLTLIVIGFAFDRLLYRYLVLESGYQLIIYFKDNSPIVPTQPVSVSYCL